MNFPTIFDMMKLVSSEGAAVNFLIESGVFQTSTSCPIENCTGRRRVIGERKRMRCNVCKKENSIRTGTFFALSKLSCAEILLVCYFWLANVSVSTCLKMTGMSPNTVCDFYRYCRQLVSDSIDEEDVIIGGEGVVVQIDECKFGKRKYHRGRRVEGVWVFGGVEVTTERRVFLRVVETRDENTLLETITRHVAPGSVIYSDCWRAYSNINIKLGFQHETVNHSRFFKDPITGVHTNMIEGTWNGIKVGIPARNRTRSDFDEHLWEFIWRRRNQNNLWDGFIKALKEIEYQ